MMKFFRNKKGQGLAEYALILALIAVIVVAAVKTLGQKVSTAFSTVASSIDDNT